MAESTKRDVNGIDRRDQGPAAGILFSRQRRRAFWAMAVGQLTAALLAGYLAAPISSARAQAGVAPAQMAGPANPTPAAPDLARSRPTEAGRSTDPALLKLQAKLRESERALAAFRAAHDPGLGDDASSASDLEKAIADTAAKLVAYQEISRLRPDGGDLDAIDELVHSPRLNQLRTQMTDLNRRESDLSATYGSAYPALAQVHAQRLNLQRAIGAEVKRLTAELKRDYEAAKALEAALRKQAQTARDRASADGSDIQRQDRDRANLTDRAAVEPFVADAKATEGAPPIPAKPQPGADPEVAPIVDPKPDAPGPASTMQGSSPVGILVGLVGGVVIGIGLAVVWHGRRERGPGRPSSKGGRKAETERGDPFILGRVPTVGPSGSEPRLWTHLEASPECDFARSIEALVVTIAPGRDEGLVVALSPLSLGEGATSIGACLAHCAGQAGKRVLLIDADPKGPNLTSLFEVTDRAGLAEVLRGGLSAGKAVTQQPHFSFLPVGRQPWATRDGLKSLRPFLAETRRRFDLVLIDAPAFDSGPEALALCTSADGFALVASSDRLLREPFVVAIDAVADKRGFAGIILNRATSPDADDLAVAV